MPELDFTIFRENLRKARHIKEISSRELSEKAGLRQLKRVADIEEGRGKPTIEEVYSLCKVLGESMEMMMNKPGKMRLDFIF